MRKTTKGKLLLEVRGDSMVVYTVKAEIARAAGDDVHDRLLQQRSMIEIRTYPLHILTYPLVIENRRYRRQHWCILPTEYANKVIDYERVKISLVNCRVRLADKSRIRYFRCLGYEHESKNCQSIDRSACYRRCGKPGHFANDCKEDVLAAVEFEKILKEESHKGLKTVENACNISRSFPRREETASVLRKALENQNSQSAGDFNSKSGNWGSPLEDERGALLADRMASMDLTVCNKGGSPTFVRGNSGTHIDITFASSRLALKVCEWEVLEVYSVQNNKPRWRLATAHGRGYYIRSAYG
ncbi:hypothetical protein AGLY_006884 [Aphis glycines]|uniref:CCHC-type domain-containing protein n=1 Tax=Aphis glycines TaxID=307491 RepID=A0A6G0TQ10_APHGL|nr:hypothetical protein AGLY_006884 [Aphis glycines]